MSKYRNDRQIEIMSLTPEVTPLGIHPLAMDFRDSRTKNVLNGDQAYIRGRDLLIMAMREFEYKNPEHSQHIFDEQGRFEDKDFVKAGYEDYLALSHLHELQPYAEKLEPVANIVIADRQNLAKEFPDVSFKIPSKEEALLPYLAQVYMAKESHMVPDRLEFMVDYMAKNPAATSEKMNLMREAFLGGQTIPDVQKWIDKPLPLAEAIRDCKPYSTPEQYNVLLSANDAETVRALSIAFEFDNIPVDVGQAIVDFNNKLEENQELKNSLPYWFKHDGKVDVFTALSNSRNITPDEVRRLGDIILNTGKSLDFDSAAERLNAFRGLDNKEMDATRKAWSPNSNKPKMENSKDTMER